MEKGASSWLSAMPIKAIEYALMIKQARIQECHMHEIWMEDRWHTHSLCLWRDKYGSASYANWADIHHQ